MKTDRMNAIGQVFRRRWTLSILVAGAWTAVVTLYVLNGLRPHGYIGDETEALFTWLGWMAGGGFSLAASLSSLVAVVMKASSVAVFQLAAIAFHSSPVKRFTCELSSASKSGTSSFEIRRHEGQPPMKKVEEDCS